MRGRWHVNAATAAGKGGSSSRSEQDTSVVYVTPIETHQHDRVTMERWASGLTRVYAEGALSRARMQQGVTSASQLIFLLEELVDALDRSIPKVERLGEAEVTAHANRLRACATQRTPSCAEAVTRPRRGPGQKGTHMKHHAKNENRAPVSGSENQGGAWRSDGGPTLRLRTRMGIGARRNGSVLMRATIPTHVENIVIRMPNRQGRNRRCVRSATISKAPSQADTIQGPVEVNGRLEMHPDDAAVVFDEANFQNSPTSAPWLVDELVEEESNAPHQKLEELHVRTKALSCWPPSLGDSQRQSARPRPVCTTTQTNDRHSDKIKWEDNSHWHVALELVSFPHST